MRTNRIRTACAGAALGLALLAATPAGAAVVPVAVSSWPTPTSSSVPSGIVLGPDGNLWFTENAVNNVARITPSGQITEFTLGYPPSTPGAITSFNGDLWFVQSTRNEVGEMTTAGTVTSEVATDTNPSQTTCGTAPTGPLAITSGPNSHLWVTETGGDAVAEINPTATPTVVSQYCINSGYVPSGIAAGTDSNLWVAADFSGSDWIVRVTSGNGDSTPEAQLTGASASTLPVLSGPDGNLYVGNSTTPSLIQVPLNNPPAEAAFPLPTSPAPDARVLGLGPDGDFWLAGGGALTQVTTGGATDEYQDMYPSGDEINGIAAGPSDTLWLTDSTGSSIYRVTLGSPQVAAQLSSATSIGTTTATLAGQLLTGGNVPQNVSAQFQYGPTTAYGSSTPAQSTTATLAGATVSANLTGLEPGTTYHYRLIASGCAPSTCSAQSADGTFTTSTPPVQGPTPVLGQSLVVESISGKIRVRLHGKRHFTVLTAGELIPVGSEVDARHGHVEIESAVASQQIATGLFNGGLFTVSQPNGGTITVLKLDSNYAACKARKQHKRQAARIARATAKPPSHKVVNQVFGTAHGQYTTRGHYAAAADEGTSWQIADRCDGTYVAVSVGQVNVTNLVTNRTFALSAGQHYLAKPH